MTTHERLRTLSFCHYVVAALHLLIGSIGLIFLLIGISIVFVPAAWNAEAETGAPEWFGYTFAIIGILIVLVGWGLAAVTAMSGMYIAARVRRSFSIVVAGINCAVFPFGTALGLFALIMLNGEDAKTEFKA